MGKYNAIIIGGGLGGLETALLLSKEGMNVCVLERHSKAGGLLQSFSRSGKLIDSSVHYVGSMDKDEALYSYFKYFGILQNLDFVRLDNDCFDNIKTEDNSYSFPMGLSNFEEYLLRKFPSESKVIPIYCRYLREVGKLSEPEHLKRGIFNLDYMDYYTYSASGVIRNYTKNPVLFDALWGTSLLYGGIEKVTPFYIHAITLYSNLKGAYRLRGGTSSVVEALVSKIEENGGKVLTGQEVTKIVVEGSKVKGVITNNNDFYECDYVVSSTHPAETFNLLDKNPLIKNSFIARILSEKNSYPLFCLYLVMKPGSFKYINRNFFIRRGNKRVNYVLLSMQPPAVGSDFAEVVTIVTSSSFSQFEKWKDTRTGNRGEDYLEYKENLEEEILDFVAADFPDLRSSIECKFSASPLTFRDYTKTPEGSAYGIQKDCNKPFSTFIACKTKLPGLYLTGQSNNVHGVLGATITSLLTCSDILGQDYLMNKIIRAI